MRISYVRLAWRLPLFLILNAILIPAYALSLGPFRRWRRPIQICWSRWCCRLAGLLVRVSGEQEPGASTLFVVNHVSYLDIPVLSQHIKAVFVAKSAVARWPLFGIIARVTGTIFVDRSLSEASRKRDSIRSMLREGESVLLFPEGTSTDGTSVAPFRPALLDVAAAGNGGPEPVIQPVSVAYTRYRGGPPLQGPLTALYCWYGDAQLLPHILRVFGLRGAEVEVRFHPRMRAGDFANRKQLAQACRDVVAAGVAAAHGRASLQPEAVVAA
jgi:1-acyl-sn-glycerol-3-phosphate acyltransferase